MTDPHDPRYSGRPGGRRHDPDEPESDDDAGTPSHDLGGLFDDVVAPSAEPHEGRSRSTRSESSRSRSRSRKPSRPAVRALRRHTRTVIWVIAAVAAVEAALSPARPVGLRAADAFWCALLGAVVVLAGSRARRVPLVWLGGVAAVVGIGGDTTAKVSAVAVLLLTGLVAASDDRDRIVGALIGAFAVQALLRGPSYGFIGLPTLVAALAVVPVLVSGYRMGRTRERKIARRTTLALVALVAVASLGAVAAAAVTYTPLRDAEDKATTGLDLVRDGDTPAATVAFDDAAAQFGDANGILEGPLTWAGRNVPVVGQHVESLRRASGAGRDLGESAAVTASTADWRDLTATGGVVDLTIVESLQAPVAQSAATLDAALTAMADVRSPWLIALVDDELDRFHAELADVSQQTDLAAQALAVAPALLGGDETQRYFVAFSTPTESRDGGGFIGAYGLLETRGGELDLVDNGNIATIYPPSRSLYQFDPPPDWDQRYGSYLVQRNLGNLAASPDWPTSTGVIGQLFPQSEDGTPIDGAVYADPAALAGFLELTGPVTLDDYDITLTAENAEQFLLVDQYVEFDGDNPERRELLADAAQATFDALTSRPLPGIAALTEVLGGLVEDGHLRVSVFDPASEALLDRVGLSGRWPVEDGSDYLSVRSANLVANKIDSFLFRDIDVATTVNPDTGELTSTVTAVLRNDAPPDGLPRYIIGNQYDLPFGTNRHVLTLHSPHQLEQVTIDGETAGVQAQREFGGPVYSVTVDLPPESTRTVVLELRGVVPAWPYALQLIPQATANPDQLTVTVDGAPGMGPAPQFDGPMGPVVALPRPPEP